MSAPHPFDEADVVLEKRIGVDGRVHVRQHVTPEEIQRIHAALRATTQMLTGTTQDPHDPTLTMDTAIAAVAFERCMTELAVWSLVLRGELMVEIVPREGGAGRVAFLTVDRQPIVIGDEVTH